MGRAGALAADGRCKPFSAGADGYGRGDGVVCLLVKTLQRALADNDRIHAVVEATAVNQNGASGGFTVPAQAAQERLIRQALSRAGRAPGEIVAVEAHGTGTRLGDPIELRALANVFSGARNRPVALGAVKASLGHLEAAAGLAGLVKLILCYRHGAFPQQPLPDGPTPHFEWNESPLESSLGFPLQPADIVGLSSFGFSGTNAHAIVSGPHPAKVNGFEPTAWIVPISAHTPEATRQRVRDLADAAATLRAEEMAAVVSTLMTGRTHLPHRTYVTAQTSSSLLAALRGIGTGAVPMPTVHDVSHLGSDPDSGALASGELTGDDLGQRFIAGLPVDWMAVARGRAVHPLPRYPWQHTSHWISPPAGNEAPTASEAPPSRRHDVSPPAPASPDTAPDTLLATIAAVAGNLGMAVDDVDPDVGFFDLGMDSVQAVAICGALGGQFGIDLEATVTFEHPNCRQLALHITDLTGRACATHPSEPTIPAPRAPLEEGRPEASETEPSLSLTSDGTSDGVTDALAELDLALNRTDALLIKGAEA
jgi:acyl transferase domain-containing protein